MPMGDRKIRVTHIINGLDPGGAEIMLASLLSHHDRDAFEPSVISLTDLGMISSRIEAAGVPLSALGMGRDQLNLSKLGTLARRLRRQKPDVVQTWMYHANLAGGLAAYFAGSPPVVWGIHATRLDRERMNWPIRTTITLNAWLSPNIPARIVCCSRESYKFHLMQGYAAEKLCFIPNGFDTDMFHPDDAARVAIRGELGLPDGARIIGLAARFNPQKDHATFIAAAFAYAHSHDDAHFVLCGTNVTWENEELAGLIGPSGLRDRFHLLGEREDMARITASFDIATVTSAYGEAFPLVIGEAMACGVPCVATQVGNSEAIIGGTGISIPPRDVEALVDAWRRLLSLPTEARRSLGEQARHRIVTSYRLSTITSAYEDTYRALARHPGRASR